MLRNSFIFLPKFRERKEQSLWNQDITDWNTFLTTEKIKGISSARKKHYDTIIKEAKQAYVNNDEKFFYNHFPSNHTWRLYNFFRDETLFLDIEASRTHKSGFLTVLGLYDGSDTKIMIKDVNLYIQAVKQELKRYKLLITFNGSSFDIPFLKRKYPHLIPNIPHWDLRHSCAQLNLIGGLKEVERKLNIIRSNTFVEKMCGGDPLKLWRMYKGSGDKHYLKILVEYNEEDVINLKKIAQHCYKKLKQNYKSTYLL